MRGKENYWIVNLISLLFFSSGYAQETIFLTDTVEEYRTHKFIFVFEDTNASYRIDQIASSEFASKFKKNEEELPINRNRYSAYWGKLVIQNNSSDLLDWYLEFPDQKMDTVEVYFQDSTGKFTSEICGDGINFSNRNFSHKNCIFRIPKVKGKEVVIYYRIHSYVVGTFTCWIRSDQHFKHYALNEYIGLGFFYGIILIMIFFNLSVFLTLKDFSYLYYVLYVLSIGLFSLFQNGIGFQYLWPNFPEINNVGKTVSILSLVVWQLLYTRSFLQTKQYAPFLHKLILYFIYLRVAIFLIGLFFSEDLLFYLPVDNVPLFLSFTAGIITFYKGQKSARFFLLGFSMLFFGFVVHSLTDIELIPNSIITVYAHDIGGSLEMIFLLLAFADKLKIEKKEKEREQLRTLEELKNRSILKQKLLLQLEENDKIKNNVNRNLESLVNDHTKELVKVNELLELQTKEIIRINELLKKDNSTLKENYLELHKSKITKGNSEIVNFHQAYPNENSCIRYLEELKWGENKYACKRCKSKKGAPGKEPNSMRCTRCNYVESLTANTLFHRIKFPLYGAFHILFLITNSSEEYTLDELADQTGVSRSACFGFRRKIMQKIHEFEASNPGMKMSWSKIILSEK